MRSFLWTFALALAALAFTTNPLRAQVVIYNSNVPSPPGVYVVSTPPFYNGLWFHNGMITAFPTGPRFGYPYGYPYGYPAPGPFYGYPPPPGPRYGTPFSSWRP